jgi:hypothetical protein
MEPERKIEKWLKAYAKKRRTQAGEPFKLPPATRRLLQSEVARDQPKPEDEDESVSLWEIIRQQWAILLSFAACIFLVGMIFFHSVSEANKRAELAKVSGTKEIGSNLPAVASEDKFQSSLGEKKDLGLAHHGLAGEPTNPVLLADNQKAMVNRDTEYSTNNAPSPTVAMTVTPSAAPAVSESIQATPLEVSPGAAAAPSPPIVEGGDYTMTRRPESSVAVSNGLNGSYASRPAPPLVAAAAPGGSFPNSQLAEQSSEAIPAAAPPVEMPPSEQNAVTFSSQIASRKVEETQLAFKNSVAPSRMAPVLENFQMQQNGNAIRLVDQDGSVYDGWLQPVNQRIEKAKNQTAPAANGRALPLTQNYFFNVYGTNRTTKQSVSFAGNLTTNFAPTNDAKLAFGFTDHPVTSWGAGFGGSGGGGGGGTVGGVLNEKKSETTNQIAQLPWASLRITGTAFISETNRIEINAAPVEPNKN